MIDPSRDTAPRGLPAKRSAIMHAAFDVFVRHGYERTTLDDVATSAGVSRQTIYNHFGDKEALFLAVLDEVLEESTSQIRRLFDELTQIPTDVQVHMLDLGRSLLAIFDSPRTADVRTLVQSEAPRNPKVLAIWQHRSTAPISAPLIGHFATLAHAGLLRLHDPALAAGQFLTLVTGAGWHMTRSGTFSSSPLDSRSREYVLTENVRLFLRAYCCFEEDG